MTYDSEKLTFVVHREAANKKNMEFRMHANVLHCCDTREDITEFAFMETVAGNKKGFTKRQIKGADTAKSLYTTLSYPSVKDYKWVIHSNQIKNFPVTVEDVATASKIWGKNADALKGKTTSRKPEVVKRDLVKLPKKLIKLHKDIYLTAGIFFVNKIPFFLTLSRRIMFTAVHHLANCTVP